jgi:ubiquinone/menaquinone biosynthesis C-methylase UbiE
MSQVADVRSAKRAQRRILRIQAAQRGEIERLGHDRRFAEAAASDPAYGLVGDWLRPPGRTLELGCGPGRFVALLATLGHEVVGVDPLEFDDWRLLRGLPGVTLYSGVRAEELPFDTASFDHVACMGALLYFEDADSALREMRRVLRPYGRLAVRTVNSGNLYTRFTGRLLDPASRRLYSRTELAEIVEDRGFQVVQSFGYGFWPPIATDLWWYLLTTRIPPSVQRALSRLLPENSRVNNVVLATAR